VRIRAVTGDATFKLTSVRHSLSGFPEQRLVMGSSLAPRRLGRLPPHEMQTNSSLSAQAARSKERQESIP